MLKISNRLPQTHNDDMSDAGAEEAALRALNRMGSRKGAAKPAATLRLSSNTDNTGTARKRRFVRDGDVPVEHHQLARTSARPVAASTGADEVRLNKALENERRARGDAERQIHDLEVAQRSLTTRLGHAEVLMAELKQTLAVRDQELADRTAELVRERATVQQAAEEIRALRKQIRKSSARNESAGIHDDVPTDENGQQPIKWWKD